LLRAGFATLPDGSHMLVGAIIDGTGAFAQKIRTAAALCGFLILILAIMASVTVTRRTVGRIEAINATSRTIMRSGLRQRIALRGTRDEWDELATNLNSMLDRIETLMEEVKQVSDNVAHDLRTPLARLRGRLEKAYMRERDGADDQKLIGDTLADLETVLRMFSALTRISQIESYDRRTVFHQTDLSEITREVVELFDAAAEEKNINLIPILNGRVLVNGDRDLLFDALANLVDNAIKYGPVSSRVIVEIGGTEAGPVVSVIDEGPGIAPEERQQVFKRFYRVEHSRRSPGNGLGLSLVAAVAHLHGIRIEMTDNLPGLKIQLWFPPAKTPELPQPGNLGQKTNARRG
jgi:signal transduction histidine kinase